MFFVLGCQDDHEESAKDRQLEDFEKTGLVWGYINRSGELQIPGYFDDCRDFAEQSAPAMFDGLWGYIDLDGNWLIEPRFLEAYEFNDDMAKVRSENGFYGVIDTKGGWLTQPEWDQMDSPKMAGFRVQKSGLWLIITPDGQSWMKQAVSTCTPVLNGRTVMKDGTKYVLNSKSGKLSKAYDQIVHSKEGIHPFRVNNAWGFLSNDGKEIIEAKYEEVATYSDGFAVVLDHGEFIIIDERGKSFFESTEELENLGQGIFLQYLENSDAGVIINHQGQVQFADTLDEVHPIKEGFSAVRKDSLWSFVNIEKKELIRPYFSPLVWSFKNGLARVIYQQSINFMDASGQIVIRKPFFEVKDFSLDGLARVQLMR